MNIQSVWHSFYGERVPIASLLRKQIPDVCELRERFSDWLSKHPEGV